MPEALKLQFRLKQNTFFSAFLYKMTVCGVALKIALVSCRDSVKAYRHFFTADTLP